MPPFKRILALTLFAGTCALAQTPPAAYQTTYSDLQAHLASFESMIPSQSNGQNSPVLWSGELLAANANGGVSVLKNPDGLTRQLNMLHSLGQRSVVVNIAFPILSQGLYTYSGDSGDYQRMLTFYTNLATQIHNLGMKMIVESAVMFTGPFSASSGFDVAGYYATLSDSQFVAGRIQNVLTVAQQVQPDFINLNSEPDTDARLTGKRSLYSTPSAYAGMTQQIVTALHNAGVTIPLGAGIPTWLNNGDRSATSPWITALLKSGIDYFDLHVYPINGNCLSNLIAYTDMAAQAGKQTAISESWLLKESDSEFQNPPNGSNSGGETFYGRDPFSFWAPLDQEFLADLQKFGSWKKLIYISPFWTKYFWAYLDYNQVAPLTPQQITVMEDDASNAAIAASQMTSTAANYRTGTGGILQVPLVSAADYLTRPQAPDSMVSIFGSNLSTGIALATTVPLPTKLNETTATIQDNSGKQEPVPFFFVSPTQINATIPHGLSNGVAVITISNQGTVVGGANVFVESVGPSLFTANENGMGAPIGVVVTSHADGSQSTEYTYQGSSVGHFTPTPINLGGTGDQSVLVLYGTGIRGRSALGNVSANIGNVSVPVEYAGPCDPTLFVAFDQVNLALPHSLAGAGQVTLTLKVNGAAAEPVTLDFQ